MIVHQHIPGIDTGVSHDGLAPGNVESSPLDLALVQDGREAIFLLHFDSLVPPISGHVLINELFKENGIFLIRKHLDIYLTVNIGTQVGLLEREYLLLELLKIDE
jgi:hypothetical protein